MQVLEGEVSLHYAGGFHAGPQYVLLRRDVGGLRYPVQIVQITTNKGGGGGWGIVERVTELMGCDSINSADMTEL